MHRLYISRRRLFRAAVTALGAYGASRFASAHAAPVEIELPENVPTNHIDFDSKGIEGWTTVDGQWVVEDMPALRAARRF